MNPPRFGAVLATVALSALALAMAGCAGEPSGVAPGQDAQGRYVVHMTANYTFSPVEVKVPAGATVVWVNDGPMEHDVNAYEGNPAGEHVVFSSSLPPPHGEGRILGPGAEFVHTFAEKGTWTVWCHQHHEHGMKGIVHVT